MIGRFRPRATDEERRFDAVLAEVIAGAPPADAPADYEDEIMVAETLRNRLALLQALPDAVETRLRQRIAEGIAARERRSIWRSLAARPVRLAAVVALVLALTGGMFSPLGHSARAAASDLWDQIVGPSTGTERPASIQTNDDGSVTITDMNGNVSTVPIMGTMTSVDSDGPGSVTIQVAP